MKPKKIKSSTAVELLVLAVLSLLLIILLNLNNHEDNIPNAQYGQPTISADNPDVFFGTEQIVHDGKYIYVLGDTSISTVQVYDLFGNYAFTISFFPQPNGAYNLIIKDNILYVVDKDKNIYVFTEGEFQFFVEKTDVVDVLGKLDLNTWRSSPDIEYRSDGSVWRVSADEEVCIFEPYTNFPTYRQLLPPILIASLVIIAMLRPLMKREHT